jgi:hypothetical protein
VFGKSLTGLTFYAENVLKFNHFRAAGQSHIYFCAFQTASKDAIKACLKNPTIHGKKIQMICQKFCIGFVVCL